MWTRLDAIGVSDPGEQAIDEPTAMVQFRDADNKDKGRYVVAIMLKSQGHLPSTNRTVVKTRLKRQLQRFLTQPGALLEYDSIIRISRREAVTTKVRVVFDASSHELGSPSLNDVLDEGVKLGAKLLQLLLQFRGSPIVLTADIRKAFLQICIRPEERNRCFMEWLRLNVARTPLLLFKRYEDHRSSLRRRLAHRGYRELSPAVLLGHTQLAEVTSALIRFFRESKLLGII
ncbi:uncharacterized protein LOC135376506 [Ornithodoros turicata]|uniref:uncharacterized protein LOC135376506 n=1 Tax=Ornithodoros turicata TaxID=34597 RepID=UPI003138B42A